MKAKQEHIILLAILFLGSFGLYGQIGINTTSPSATLDVIGDVIIDQTLTLENPGKSLQIRDLNLLVTDASNNIKQYDIEISKYGPVNSAQFLFENVSTNGLQDYDTKVPISNYIMVVHSFFFKRSNETSYGVMEDSSISTENVEGYQVYAYKNISTNTWFLRAFVNNANFESSTSGSPDIEVDIFLNVVVYRKGLMTQVKNDINVDMSGNATGTSPLPSIFVN